MRMKEIFKNMESERSVVDFLTLVGNVEQFMFQGKFNEALKEISSLNNKFPYRCESRQLYKRVQSLKQIEESALRNMLKKRYTRAIKKFNSLEADVRCLRLTLLKIESLVMLNASQLNDGENIAIEKYNLPDAITMQDLRQKLYIKALIHYYNGELEDSLSELNNRPIFGKVENCAKATGLQNKILVILHNLSEAKKFREQGDLKSSVQIWKSLLNVDPENKSLTVKILTKMGFAYAQLGMILEADDVYARLNTSLGVNHQTTRMQNLGDAIRLARRPIAPSKPTFTNGDVANVSTEDFHATLYEMSQKDAHSLLELPREQIIPIPTIHKAATKLIKQYHPDNHASNPENYQCCVEIFQLIKKAENMLSQDMMRLKTINEDS